MRTQNEKTNKNACRVSYARTILNSFFVQFLLESHPYGHVKLLTLVSLPVPRISPLSSLGTRALAQHCSATLLMRSTSSSFSLSCLFASLLLRSFTPLCSTCAAFANGMEGYVSPLFCSACVGRAEVGDETKLSRFTHSAMRAWIPADSCVARQSRYGHMSPSSFQNGSEASAERRAGRICGSGGRLLPGLGTSSSMGVPVGEATEAVERREAAMVRRMCDSVDRVVFTTHAVSNVSLILFQEVLFIFVPGQPVPLHHSSSSVRMHCRHRKAPLASPAKASSRSSVLRVHSAASARAEARLNRVTTGMMSACRMSRCSSHVSCACESH
jgi:hypothetical protein